MHMDSWLELGRRAPTELEGARLAVHYAAQPLAAAAYALLPMREDHSHTNLLWVASRRGFVGRELTAMHRGFLDPVGLRIGLLDKSGAEVDFVTLQGKTLAGTFGDFADVLRRAGEDLSSDGLRLPDYDLPASDLATSATFASEEAELTELAAWFHDADSALTRLSSTLLEGAEVRGWPHHFDLAALRTLKEGVDAESSSSIGAGFSPGDGSYSEPYYYVSPWPYPKSDELPSLASGGHWHTQGFTAAVLTASTIVAAGSAEKQQRLVDDFLATTVDASLRLLEP